MMRVLLISSLCHEAFSNELWSSLATKLAHEKQRTFFVPDPESSSVLNAGETTDLVCFSHLRWDFVYQHPQHLLSRCAKNRRVFFVEEPVFGKGSMRFDTREMEVGVPVVVPHLPQGLSLGLSKMVEQKLHEATHPFNLLGAGHVRSVGTSITGIRATQWVSTIEELLNPGTEKERLRQAHWQREHCVNKAMTEELQYWKSPLDRVKPDHGLLTDSTGKPDTATLTDHTKLVANETGGPGSECDRLVGPEFRSPLLDELERQRITIFTGRRVAALGDHDRVRRRSSVRASVACNKLLRQKLRRFVPNCVRGNWKESKNLSSVSCSIEVVKTAWSLTTARWKNFDELPPFIKANRYRRLPSHVHLPPEHACVIGFQEGQKKINDSQIKFAHPCSSNILSRGITRAPKHSTKLFYAGPDCHSDTIPGISTLSQEICLTRP